MSHLSLDARAILEYLNELGYRNISAEQLKEFMKEFGSKGMQRQSEISSSSRSKTQQKPKGSSSSNTSKQQEPKFSKTANSTKATRASSPKQEQQLQLHHQQHSQRNPIKIIKSRKPLIHFKFYLDICDHQVTKKIEEKIKQLGGTLEFFLTSSVTHFITDKNILPATVGNNNNTLSSCPGTPQTPYTPGTPKTPYSIESQAQTKNKSNASTPSSSKKAPVRQSRADAILNRARRISAAVVASSVIATKSKDLLITTPTTPKATIKLESNSQQNYVVWQIEQALRFFAKIQNDLKEYLTSGITRERKTNNSSKLSRTFGPTHLKGSFIKIESLKRNYRPYYQLFKKPAEWPKIELTREDGAFRLSPKKELDNLEDKKMTRKSRSRSSQRQQQQQQPPLPITVQALKKTEIATKSSGGQKATNCKQAAKESSEKQCGVCEICKIEYDTLTIHLKTKDHEYFAKNSQNFLALDTLITSSADVNKFLEENNKEEAQEMELEEMEVEEQDINSDTNAALDPLDNTIDYQHIKSNSGYNTTPSPTLREKSKRITKGKHSSEKFQNKSSKRTSLTKSPKSATATAIAPNKINSPKKQTTFKIATNADERVSTRNRTAAVATKSVFSPPMRAMLPPSSMYKVVDASPAVNTTLKKTQTAGNLQTPNSPSLIVKFKKVRETELCRLSGEADRFMFRTQRASSELPTDLDRQTTSERIHANNSSASLDSSCNESSLLMDLVCEKTETNELTSTTLKGNKNSVLQQKAVAIAKRRKAKVEAKPLIKRETSATPIQRQRFPSAPIQPKIQLKNSRNARTTIETISTLPTNLINNSSSRRITLPEATRKSSRTATAIVTAATTSSRLLRAAVEAAKKAGNNDTISITKRKTPTAQIVCQNKIKRSSSRLPVLKMEDRMGDADDEYNDKTTKNQTDTIENYNNKGNTRKSRTAKQLALFINAENLDDENDHDYDEYDDDDEEEEITEDDDSDKDEDFILNRKMLKQANITPIKQKTNSTNERYTTREERAARRWTQRIESLESIEVEDDNIVRDFKAADKEEVAEEEEIAPKYGKRRKLSLAAQTPSSKQQSRRLLKQTETPKSKPIKKVIISSPPQRSYDITKSERLPKMRYAFERLPVTDLWYRVYKRQDACEERYFEYYGTTQYRKLPYELGPIPFDYTLNDGGPAGKCCTLCQKAGRISTKSFKELKLKHENQEQTEVDELTTTNGKIDISTKCATITASTSTTAATTTTTSYTHKHKKLHLLQRYHQEMLQQQQQQQQQHKQKITTTDHQLLTVSKCDSKASTPERELTERERIVRAGSTHSNTSSCTASSTATTNSKHKYHNKHLNKAAFLNLELPPRKSPREHASTLALVSCIIRQRQDSLSKPNSETDEPALPPASDIPMNPILPTAIEEEIIIKNHKKSPSSSSVTQATNTTPLKLETVEKSITPDELRSPSRTTRSAAATPVEELRFATEISENVKRMRRGQNKYDHSPPIILKTARSTRGKCKVSTAVTSPPLDRSSYIVCRKQQNSPQTSLPPPMLHSVEIESKQRRRPRSLLLPTTTTTTLTAVNSSGQSRRRAFGRPPKMSKTSTQQQPSIRKTGCKKGVLEFEVDATALRALKSVMAPKPSVRQLEWEIDKYLEIAAKDYDCQELNDMLLNKVKTLLPTNEAANIHTKSKKATKSSATKTTTNYGDVNTPPPTDCFSSDFDLYDLFTCNKQKSSAMNAGVAEEEELSKNTKSTNFSLYSSVALQNYFRKRKSLKSNRTGWPKAQKKKTTTMRHQHVLRQKIRFLPNGEQQSNDTGTVDGERIKAAIEDEVNSTQDIASTNGEQRTSSVDDGDGEGEGNGVITPPDSEVDDNATVTNVDDYGDDDDDDDNDGVDDAEFLDVIDDIEALECNVGVCENEVDDHDCDVDGDGETIADSIEIERCCTADFEAEAAAAEADIEAEDDVDFEDDTTTMFLEQRSRKRLPRRSDDVISPIIMTQHSNSTLHPQMAAAGITSTPTTQIATTITAAAATTTPGTANMLRGGGLRRTPVLLNGSLGSCISPSEKAGDNSDIFTVSSDGLDTDLDISNSHTQFRGNDNETQQQQQHDGGHCPHRTPKRKYDISKYAPNNKNSRTCAAEAATAAAKSLAISQFLKKEVRVTCRRLRPPFRRFRFRR